MEYEVPATRGRARGSSIQSSDNAAFETTESEQTIRSSPGSRTGRRICRRPQFTRCSRSGPPHNCVEADQVAECPLASARNRREPDQAMAHMCLLVHQRTVRWRSLILPPPARQSNALPSPRPCRYHSSANFNVNRSSCLPSSSMLSRRVPSTAMSRNEPTPSR